MNKLVKYITRKAYATTKQGTNYIVDRNSIVIDNSIEIPEVYLNKVINAPYFIWNEVVKENTNELQIDKNEFVRNVENNFKSYCLANNIKYKSKAYYKAQHIYFNCAVAILNWIPPNWGVCLLSNREIIDSYTITK